MAPKPKHEMDERVSIPLDPEEAIRALLQVDPNSEPTEAATERCPKTSMGRRCLLRAGHFGPCQFAPA